MRYRSFLATALVLSVLSISFGEALAERGRSRGRGAHRTHVVKRGETLSEIAQKHGVRVDDLAAVNKMNPEEPLSVGATLKLPRPGDPRYHVVRSGETLVQIAKIEGCTVADLSHYNKLGRASRLQVGQVLKIPEPGPPPSRSRSRKRTHVVRRGETLNEIAHQYGIGTIILKRANNIRDPRSIQPGRELVIPPPSPRSRGGKGGRVSPLQQSRRVSGYRKGGVVIHYAMDGQSWRSLARAYRKSIRTLRSANPRLGSRLRPGTPVRIPGVRAPVAVPVANCGYPGIRFQSGTKQQTIRLLRCNGRVNPQGRRQLSYLAASGKGRPSRLLSSGLLKRLQRIADEFPGRPFRVVSGYRAPEGERGSSRHNYGRALDFSIEGVSNRRLYEFCRTLPRTGCGYYPNSTFVHVDFRDRSAAWVDYAGPGEAPDYAPRGDDGEPVEVGESED